MEFLCAAPYVRLHYPERVRGYCPFAVPRPRVDIARAATELTETAPDASTILSRVPETSGSSGIGSAAARAPNSSHLYSERFRSGPRAGCPKPRQALDASNRLRLAVPT